MSRGVMVLAKEVWCGVVWLVYSAEKAYFSWTVVLMYVPIPWRFVAVLIASKDALLVPTIALVWYLPTSCLQHRFVVVLSTPRLKLPPFYLMLLGDALCHDGEFLLRSEDCNRRRQGAGRCHQPSPHGNRLSAYKMSLSFLL